MPQRRTIPLFSLEQNSLTSQISKHVLCSFEILETHILYPLNSWRARSCHFIASLHIKPTGQGRGNNNLTLASVHLHGWDPDQAQGHVPSQSKATVTLLAPPQRQIPSPLHARFDSHKIQLSCGQCWHALHTTPTYVLVVSKHKVVWACYKKWKKLCWKIKHMNPPSVVPVNLRHMTRKVRAEVWNHVNSAGGISECLWVPAGQIPRLYFVGT